VGFILWKNPEGFNSIRGKKTSPNRSGSRLNRDDTDQVLSTTLIDPDMWLKPAMHTAQGFIP
jgi:hypothetical protein